MGEKIKEILKYAVMAPSGDNSQPWRFEIDGAVLKVYNLPEKDNPYLNYMQGGSYIAHGALLKNIEVSAPCFNLIPTTKLFPSTEEKDLVAEISFTESAQALKEDPLFRAIPERATNRRPYKNKKFEQKESIFLDDKDLPEGVNLHFITDTENKKLAGGAGSIAEVIILENEMLHEYLFKDVMWSKEEESKERHGLYIDTMEFNPVQKFLFKLASNKKLMRIAVKIRFPYFIAKQDAALYASGSALGVLTLTQVTPENFIKLGMKTQELWLKATSLSLAFQPVTATLFLGFKLKNEKNDKELSNTHKEIAFKAYAQIFEAFKLNQDEVPLFMFRVGYAKAPSARSSRKEPVIHITS